MVCDEGITVIWSLSVFLRNEVRGASKFRKGPWGVCGHGDVLDPVVVETRVSRTFVLENSLGRLLLYYFRFRDYSRPSDNL